MGLTSFEDGQTSATSGMMRVRALMLACVLGVVLPKALAGKTAPSAALNLLLLPDRPALAAVSDSRPGALLQRMRGGGDVCRCKFEVRVPHTKPGDTVVMLGSGEELNNWDKGRAIELTTTADDFPWWSSELAMPIGRSFEYKLAIRSASGSMSWEPLPARTNRPLVVPNTNHHVVTLMFGDPQTLTSRSESTAGDSEDVACDEYTPTGLLAMLSPRRPRKTQRALSPFQSPAPVGQRRFGDVDNVDVQNYGASSVASSPSQQHTPSKIDVETFGGSSGTSSPIRRADHSSVHDDSPGIKTMLSSSDQNAVAPIAEGGAKAHRGLTAKRVMITLLRVLFAPITLPVWIAYHTVNNTFTLFKRVCATVHSIFFEADPDKFERVLIANIARMEGSMNRMNGSLTTAITTVDKQMGDVKHLEKLWQLEHDKYLSALEEANVAETELLKNTRQFREELSDVIKAAVTRVGKGEEWGSLPGEAGGEYLAVLNNN